MGLGYLDSSTGDINLLVNFKIPLSTSAQQQWINTLKLAAERFHSATRQKLRIKTITWDAAGNVTAPTGLHTADLIVHANLDQRGYAYLNRFSRRSGTANVGANHGVGGLEGTIVHELAHYILNVSDEYRTDWFSLEIDRDVDLDVLIETAEFPNPVGPNISPDELKGRIIPLIPGQQIPEDFTNFRVRIGNDLQNRVMFTITDTYMTTNAPFLKQNANGELVNAIPQQDARSPVFGYETSACGAICMMEDSSYDGGDSAGDLFCNSGNHEVGSGNQVNNINAQHALHAQSCWQTISETLLEEHDFDINAAPVVSYIEPEFVQMQPERRFALVFDRSGSMASGSKMQEARQAAEVWLNTYLPGEFVSVSWYNTAPQTTLSLTELVQGSAGDYANQLNVTPEGGTNIRDALLEGLNQVQNGASGQAAVKAVVLMTDGLHNHPSGSDAHEAIENFKQAHTPIHAIGFGPSNEVDMALLDDLAGRTGGVAYASSEEPFTDSVIKIGLELRGGLILDWDGELGSSDPKNDIRRPEVKKPTKPSPLRLLADHKLTDFRVKPTGRPARENAVSIPVAVEKGSVRAFFYWHKRNLKDGAWLYLLDPNDEPVEFDSLGKAYYEKDGITQVVIEKPTPGTWHMMIIKDNADKSATQYSAIAGVENPRLSVHGDANKRNAKGAPVRIWANAVWDEPLSDLRVTAEITAPNGSISTIDLHEPESDLRERGLFEGIFLPKRGGRYKGRLRICNTGKATKALAGSHPAHDELKVDEKSRINVKSDAPCFVRYVNFYFNSGDHPKAVDQD